MSGSNRTATPATGRPERLTTWAANGEPSRDPAGARCPSPASTVMDEGTGSTTRLRAPCSPPGAVAVSWVSPELMATIAPVLSTVATAGSPLVHAGLRPAIGCPRGSSTRTTGSRRSPSWTRATVSSTTSAEGRWRTTTRRRASSSPTRTTTTALPEPAATTVPAWSTVSTAGSVVVHTGCIPVTAAPRSSVASAAS